MASESLNLSLLSLQGTWKIALLVTQVYLGKLGA